MMNRRLVNLAMKDYKNSMYSLHRMDLPKLLFYPSTAQAEAAAAGVRRRVDKGKPAKPPPKIRELRLPPPIMGFDPFPAGSSESDASPLSPYCSDDIMFVLLHGHGPRRGRSSSEASRILFTSSAGQSSMYDIDSRSVISVPDLTKPTYSDTIPIVTGTGAGAGEETLYVMRSESEFKALDFSSGEDNKSSMSDSSLLWQSLPPLPVPDDADADLSSFTVVDSDRIICVSAEHWQRDPYAKDVGTFCFDTVSQEWWKAGDWVLPFHGRAQHVPELDTWLGFSDDDPHHDHYSAPDPHHLCAADLSGVAMAPREAPTLQHVWEDYNPPPMEEEALVLNKDYPDIVRTTRVKWEVMQLFLVNLGSGRFCVAKVVEGMKTVSLSYSWDPCDYDLGTFTVLTGVEVIRGDDDGELRMVKHKSRQLVHPGHDVACVF